MNNDRESENIYKIRLTNVFRFNKDQGRPRIENSFYITIKLIRIYYYAVRTNERPRHLLEAK